MAVARVLASTDSRPAPGRGGRPALRLVPGRAETPGPVTSVRATFSPQDARPWAGAGASFALHATIAALCLAIGVGGEAPVNAVAVEMVPASAVPDPLAALRERQEAAAVAAVAPRPVSEVPPETTVTEPPPDAVPDPVTEAPSPDPVVAVQPAVSAVELAAVTEPPPMPKRKPAPPRSAVAATEPVPDPPPAPAASAAPPAARSTAAAKSGLAVIRTPRFRRSPDPPRYPPRALAMNQEGTVVVRALVSPQGESGEIVVHRSSGFGLLDEAAVRAVAGWAFEPARIGGVLVHAWVEVPVRFAIR